MNASYAATNFNNNSSNRLQFNVTKTQKEINLDKNFQKKDFGQKYKNSLISNTKGK